VTDDHGSVTDEEIMAVIRRHRAPAVGTADIADEVTVTRQAVDHRLRNLEQDGLVERYKAGRDVVWYLTRAGDRYLDKD